jgi:general secretion pathway protein F
MPVFDYKGYDSGGKSVKGLKEADSGAVLRQVLRREGVFVTTFNESRAGKGKAVTGKGFSKEVDFSKLFGKIKAQDVAVFTRQLATLLRAGIPLAESLAALIDQVENQRMQQIVTDVRRAVNEGSSLADAMAEHPKMYEPLYVNMVRSGEAAGNLDEVLFQLADFSDNQISLRNKVLSAMLYPIIMVIVGGIILTVLMVVVVPQITQLFEDMQQSLPWNTVLLILLSNALGNYWWAIGGGLALFAVLFRAWLRSEAGRKKWDRFRLRVPIFGDLGRKVAFSRFSGTLGTMLAAGVPLLRALDIVKHVLGNTLLEDVVDKTKEAIKEGDSIAAPLKRSGQFPPMMVHMIAVGERSGELEGMLTNVSVAYQTEVELKLSRLTTLLEPFMIIVMGGIVAFVVFSILMPILQMNQMVQ